MTDRDSLNAIDSLEIEPLSDELLAGVAGATSTGASCCSCSGCSNQTKPSLSPAPAS
ncbi:MAG: hypothetical protein ABW277_08045 [Longimicrobiaceae bacterium]